MSEPRWEPFERAVIPRSEVEQAQRDFGLSETQMQELLQGEFWMNNLYQVEVRRIAPPEDRQVKALIWLSIRRRDREPIHDWRHIQRIKNEVIGPEYEAVELYPAESRKVDTSSQFHLFVVDDPTFRFPFGFQERLVMENPGGKAKQRPFDKDDPWSASTL